jgi:hypothetical protein
MKKSFGRLGGHFISIELPQTQREYHRMIPVGANAKGYCLDDECSRRNYVIGANISTAHTRNQPADRFLMLASC